jgi:hypothetical protein
LTYEFLDILGFGVSKSDRGVFRSKHGSDRRSLHTHTYWLLRTVIHPNPTYDNVTTAHHHSILSIDIDTGGFQKSDDALGGARQKERFARLF